MRLLVLGPVRRVGEPLGALELLGVLAAEGFVARVNQLMGLKVAFSDETLITALEGADEGPFASLYTQETMFNTSFVLRAL